MSSVEFESYVVTTKEFEGFLLVFFFFFTFLLQIWMTMRRMKS